MAVPEERADMVLLGYRKHLNGPISGYEFLRAAISKAIREDRSEIGASPEASAIIELAREVRILAKMRGITPSERCEWALAKADALKFSTVKEGD